MKIKTVSSAILSIALMSSAMMACAFNEGHLDETWFATRIKTTVKPYRSVQHTEFSEGPSGISSSPIEFDSGRNACYSVMA